MNKFCKPRFGVTIYGNHTISLVLEAKPFKAKPSNRSQGLTTSTPRYAHVIDSYPIGSAKLSPDRAWSMTVKFPEEMRFRGSPLYPDGS